MHERRRDSRLGLRCPIRFHAPQSGTRGRSVTENVSARGAYFRTVAWRDFAVDETLDLSLAVGPGGAFEDPIRLNGRGRVVRIDAPVSAEDLTAGGVALELDSPLDLVPLL